ncbi:serine hydrolase domain-containing protein [Actinoplanes sp. NPDC023714]|uniref:serine hydrolase domain-containing protein n=1 Tax=Actinoplanes sp. NPDC023714 TaxID=3154322 RepID=UPI0033E611AF
MTPANAEDLVADGFGTVADAFRRTVREPDRSGAALSIWLDGVPIVESQAGTADPAAGRRYRTDTLTRIFSGTKGLAAIAIGMLVERGLLPSWDVPVADFWPGFAAYGKGRVTIGDVLAHRAGLSAPRRPPRTEQVLDELALADILAAQEPLWRPGEHHQYHALTLGALTSKLIQNATGESFRRFLDREVLDPLGADVWVGLPPDQHARLSVLLDDPGPVRDRTGDIEALLWVDRANTLHGACSLDDYRTAAVMSAGLASAGGVATASGVARVWSATVTPTKGVRLLRDTTVQRMCRPRSVGMPRFAEYIEGPWNSWGAGVMIPSDKLKMLSSASFGHEGLGGQLTFADSDARVGFAYLTNQMGDFDRAASVVEALAGALG